MEMHVPKDDLDNGGPCVCDKCECMEDGIPHIDTGD